MFILVLKSFKLLHFSSSISFFIQLNKLEIKNKVLYLKWMKKEKTIKFPSSPFTSPWSQWLQVDPPSPSCFYHLLPYSHHSLLPPSFLFFKSKMWSSFTNFVYPLPSLFRLTYLSSGSSSGGYLFIKTINILYHVHNSYIVYLNLDSPFWTHKEKLVRRKTWKGYANNEIEKNRVEFTVWWQRFIREEKLREWIFVWVAIEERVSYVRFMTIESN